MGDKKRDFMKMHEGKIGKQYNFDDSDEDPVYYPEQPVRTQRVVEPDGDKVRDFMRMHEGKIGKQYNFDDADEDPVYYPEQPVRTQRVVEPDVNGFYYVQNPASESRVEETSTRSVSILPRTWQNMPEDQMRTLAKRFNLDAKCVNKQELIDKLSAFAKKDTTQKCGRSISDKRQFNDSKKKAYTMAQHLDCWDGNDFNFPDHLQLKEKPLYIGRRQVPDWMVQDLKRVQSEKGSQVHKRPEPEPVLTTDGPANGGGATQSDDKASDTPVEMTSNGSDTESTSNSSENDGSDVPEEHVLCIHVFHHERRGYVQPEYIPDCEGDDEYRLEKNRKHLEDWRNGIDPYAPEVQVDPPEGQCWNCGGTFWPYGLECRCSGDVRANRPGPEPRVCTNYWPKQFTYEGERFGHRIPTTPLMEEHREKQNQLLFQAWYKKRCME